VESPGLRKSLIAVYSNDIGPGEGEKFSIDIGDFVVGGPTRSNCD
jgi:hypothetical protein